MKTLLVLGASEGQLPAYRAARHLGLRTIGVDQNPAAVAAGAADKFYCVSTRDVTGIRRAIGRSPVHGVISPASDASALAVRALCRAYRTPFCVSRRATLASLDKAFFRSIVDHLALPRYGWVAGTRIEDVCTRALTLTFPVVVKPCQSSGSKGLSIVTDSDGVADAANLAQKFGFGDGVIVEELVDGVHYSAECFIADHRPVFTALIQRTLTARPRLITLEQLAFGRADPAITETVQQAVSRICSVLDLKGGPLNLDFLISQSGDLHLIEMAARLGGNGISRLVQHSSGVRVADAAVQMAVGEKPDIRSQIPRLVLVRILEAPVDGTIAAIHGARTVAALPQTVELELFVGVGTAVHPYNEAGHKIGYLAVTGDSEHDARRALREALSILHFDITLEANNG
jgi:biotin carboxylase